MFHEWVSEMKIYPRIYMKKRAKTTKTTNKFINEIEFDLENETRKLLDCLSLVRKNTGDLLIFFNVSAFFETGHFT